MQATDKDDESIVGDECHIVSSKPNGPRHDSDFPDSDLDDYSNLILLCRIHHKMVDDQFETYTSSILHQIKDNHENWVSEVLDIAASDSDYLAGYSNTFRKVNSMMPELILEMKQDLMKEGNQFIREFFISSKRWMLNIIDPCFVYFSEDHENLQSKVNILENYGLVFDVTPGNAKKYRMTEEFVDLILKSWRDLLGFIMLIFIENCFEYG